jgi:hypothetical protein
MILNLTYLESHKIVEMIFDEEKPDKSAVEEKLRDQMYIFRKKQSPYEIKRGGLE